MAGIVVVNIAKIELLEKGDLSILESLKYADEGEPFMAGPSDDYYDLETLGYAYMGEPFMIGP